MARRQEASSRTKESPRPCRCTARREGTCWVRRGSPGRRVLHAALRHGRGGGNHGVWLGLSLTSPSDLVSGIAECPWRRTPTARAHGRTPTGFLSPPIRRWHPCSGPRGQSPLSCVRVRVPLRSRRRRRRRHRGCVLLPGRVKRIRIPPRSSRHASPLFQTTQPSNHPTTCQQASRQLF